MSFGTLTAEQAKILQGRYNGIKRVWPFTDEEKSAIKCLHDQCPYCGGSGVRKDGLGLCFHGIACPCPKCSFTC